MAAVRQHSVPAIQNGVRFERRIDRTVVVQCTVGRPVRAKQSAKASRPPRVEGPRMAVSRAIDSGRRCGSRCRHAKIAAASGGDTSVA